MSNQERSIRAKFAVTTVAKDAYGNETTKANAVYGRSTNAEDNGFSAATPSGSFEIMVSNPSAIGFLEPGDTFYIDITIAEKFKK